MERTRSPIINAILRHRVVSICRIRVHDGKVPLYGLVRGLFCNPRLVQRSSREYVSSIRIKPKSDLDLSKPFAM